LSGNRAHCPPEVILRDNLVDRLSRTGAAYEVRKLLLEDVANRPSFAAVAKVLRTPSRTLRRHLKLQSTSFRQLSAELKAQFALQCLRCTNMTIEDIAYALGFSDAANFRHAFRRWTGKAPNGFRQQTNKVSAAASAPKRGESIPLPLAPTDFHTDTPAQDAVTHVPIG
jgi:AraC-like DNA-binding protein